MPHAIKYLADDQIVLIEATGDVSIDDAIETSRQIVEKLDQSPYDVVHIVADVTNQTKPPVMLSNLRRVTAFLRHTKIGWVVLVGGRSIEKFLVTVVSGITKMKLKTFDTRIEAYNFLQGQDSSLELPQERPV